MTARASGAVTPACGAVGEADAGGKLAASAIKREATRQQWLLQALWSEPEALAELRTWMVPTPDLARGLAAYQGNANAAAARALAAAYPTVAALIGDEALAALARDHWSAHPPQCGDLGEWGAGLPGSMAGLPGLDEVPYLPDCARLDWAVHRASRADDPRLEPGLLDRLAGADPAASRWRLAPGSALIGSVWPVASLWAAHCSGASDAFDRAREALRSHRGEAAFVVREGWAVRVHALGPADAAFTQALLEGRSVAAALDHAQAHGAGAFALDTWLARAWTAQWIVAVDHGAM